MPYYHSRSRRPRVRYRNSSVLVNPAPVDQSQDHSDPNKRVNKAGFHPTVVVHMADLKKMIYNQLRENKITPSAVLNRYLQPGAMDPMTRARNQGLNRVHDFGYSDGYHYSPTGAKIPNPIEYPSTMDALHWMDYGFTSQAMLNSASRTPLGFHTRPAWNEDDGDIDIGRLAAGFDDFYLGRTEQLSKPGIHIQFDCWFAALVNNTTISEYGRWIMQLIAGMESMGFDLTIDAYSVTNNTFRGDTAPRAIAIRVKNQKEGNDMASYSCLFSPIGTRLIVFSAMAAGAIKVGTDVSGYFGMARGGAFDLKYDKEKSIVRITANQMSTEDFPGEMLTQQAVEAGLIPAQ